MKKNVASQIIGTQMLATDGTAFTGTVTIYITGDNGTQTIGSVGSGVCAHKGNGWHSYVPAQAETNYNHVALTFVGTGAVPVTLQTYTTFPQTGDSFLTTSVLPSAAPGAAGGLLRAGTNLATSFTQGVAITNSTTNGAGLTVTGNGDGSAIDARGGLDGGHGLNAIGGGLYGDGISAFSAFLGSGISASGSRGVRISATGAIAGYPGLHITTTNSNATAVQLQGNGTGAALKLTGGATGVPIEFDVETGFTFHDALRLMSSAMIGKVSGMATTTVTFRNVGDTKNRITATVDADGNRSAITLDAT